MLGRLAAGSGETNIVRLLTDNPRAGRTIANLGEVLAELTVRLRLEALEAGDDPVLAALVGSLEAAGARHPHRRPALSRRPAVPLEFHGPGERLRFLSVIAQFGTSEDVTVRDLRLELLFPVDDPTRAAMAALAGN